MRSTANPQKYFLLDANLVAGYYLPPSISGKNGTSTKLRIATFFESCRKGAHPEWHLIIPNIVIAEVFSVLAKYSFSLWNTHVKKALPKDPQDWRKGARGLDTRLYHTLTDRFHRHIHNGQFFHQVEVNRYDILGVDLVAPIDHKFQHRRGSKARKMPMQTVDMLVLAMGIRLNHQLGSNRFVMLTVDSRMCDICELARRGIRDKTAEKLGVQEKATRLGYKYCGEMYPRVLNLSSSKNSELTSVFGEWPLEIPKRSSTDIIGLPKTKW